MPLHMRALTTAERAAAVTAQPNEYDEALRQMQPGTAYAIEFNGQSERSVRVQFGRAARRRGQTLRWAKTPTGLALELHPGQATA